MRKTMRRVGVTGDAVEPAAIIRRTTKKPTTLPLHRTTSNHDLFNMERKPSAVFPSRTTE